jgi:hypothetical protein
MSESKNREEIKKEILKISENIDRHLNKIQKLLELGYLDEAVILTVVIFEVLLKDLFKTCKGVWIHCGSGSDISCMDNEKKFQSRKIIKDYLEEIRVYNNFLKIR